MVQKIESVAEIITISIQFDFAKKLRFPILHDNRNSTRKKIILSARSQDSARIRYEYH